MKHYKLLKDLPFTNKGEIVEAIENGMIMIEFQVWSPDQVKEMLETGWLEEVDDQPGKIEKLKPIFKLIPEEQETLGQLVGDVRSKVNELVDAVNKLTKP